MVFMFFCCPAILLKINLPLGWGFLIFEIKEIECKMDKIFLLLGSNLGDRLSNLMAATELIQDTIGQIERSSSIYASEPWGYKSNQQFINQLIIVSSSLLPETVLSRILSIEKQLGRERRPNGLSDRTIDIDILFYGNRVINSPKLTIPHPAIEVRLFALLPLAEIANGFMQPKSHKSMDSLLQECKDNGLVEKIPGP